MLGTMKTVMFDATGKGGGSSSSSSDNEVGHVGLINALASSASVSPTVPRRGDGLQAAAARGRAGGDSDDSGVYDDADASTDGSENPLGHGFNDALTNQRQQQRNGDASSDDEADVSDYRAVDTSQAADSAASSDSDNDAGQQWSPNKNVLNFADLDRLVHVCADVYDLWKYAICVACGACSTYPLSPSHTHTALRPTQHRRLG